MARLLLAMILVLVPPLTAQAEKTRPTNDIYREMSAFSKTLNAEQTRHFYILYNNYNMIQNVSMVRQDISRAIDSCSDNNPDMEDKLRKNFKDWTDQIDPPLKEAKLKLDNMVATQKYAEPARIHEIFQLVDDTREEAQSDIKKIPVSTPESCDYLLVKLDNTEAGLVNMLQSTLIDYPDSLPEKGREAEESGLDIQAPKNSKNQ